MDPIEVSDKLWEVKISNGKLGSSGFTVDAITKRKYPLRRKMTKGGYCEEMLLTRLKMFQWDQYFYSDHIVLCTNKL